MIRIGATRPGLSFSGLLLYIFQGPKEQRNLVRLRELIMEGDVDAYGVLTKKGGDPRGDAFDALLAMMKSCPEGPYRHVIVGSANSLSKMSPNQRGSVLTMTMEHTSFLDMPEIRRISMSSDFLLEDLKNRGDLDLSVPAIERGQRNRGAVAAHVRAAHRGHDDAGQQGPEPAPPARHR